MHIFRGEGWGGIPLFPIKCITKYLMVGESCDHVNGGQYLQFKNQVKTTYRERERDRESIL